MPKAGSSKDKMDGRRRASTKGVKATMSSESQTQRRLMNGGFAVVKIGQWHTCYVRKHQGGQEEEQEHSADGGRTMFLVNLPVDTTERHIRALYAQRAGAIERVQLWKGKGTGLVNAVEEEEEEADAAPAIVALPSLDPRHPSPLLPSSTSAHITFLDASSLQRALEMNSFPSWPDPFESPSSKAIGHSTDTPPIGLAFLQARHRALRPPLDSVRTHVDSVIANFEWRLKHPKRKVNAIEAVSVGPNGELLDADGFTIVQATGKYGRTSEGQTGGASVRVARSRAAQSSGRRRSGGEDEGERDGAGPAKKKKRLELDDFYRFQRREAKRQELADLRAKFQADQEKIKQLKASRNFKPF